VGSAGLVVTSWLQHTSRDGEPHDHIHNVIARMARTDSDGLWRAVDTMALRAQLGVFGAIQEVRVKAALAREFGVKWVARADGAGHEIEGITQQTLDAFSTRAHVVTQAQLRLAREWTRKHGRAPNAREMQYLGLKANKVTRKGKEGEIDWDKLTAEWDAALGGQLAAVAENACDFQAQPGEVAGLPPREVRERAIEQALANVQVKNSTWTRSDLMKNLAWAMGQEFAHLPADAWQELLEQMTEQALGVNYGAVCLEAPEWPVVPRSLVRELDGRSVYCGIAELWRGPVDGRALYRQRAVWAALIRVCVPKLNGSQPVGARTQRPPLARGCVSRCGLKRRDTSWSRGGACSRAERRTFRLSTALRNLAVHKDQVRLAG
jgi:hypothetical protein